MKKVFKNQKGFTLAEEVVTILLVGILITAASGILLNAMRIFCQNVITLTAQEKGIAVMQQLDENLEYAKEINTEATSGTNPYQMELYTETDGEKNYLTVKTNLKYSKDDTTGHSATNRVCSLGAYEAIYTINGSSGTNQVVVDLKINRHGTTYYSERRTIELKNITIAGTGFFYDSEHGGSLYIEGLE